MGTEIERKFLVKEGAWQDAPRTRYRQGYLNTDKERTVRVRVKDDEGYLTIKGLTVGATRLEFEYTIPVDDAEQMLDELCEKPLIEKYRYKVEKGRHTWEVDEFFGANEGLLLAEVELESEEEAVEKPSWIVEEVTGDPRYFNANLVGHPYSEWGEA
jgi:CYTH domain-containing protein